jgi:signal transduction histidine kinase
MPRQALRAWWQWVRQDRATRYFILPAFVVTALLVILVLYNARKTAADLVQRDQLQLEELKKAEHERALLQAQVDELGALKKEIDRLEAEITTSKRTPTGRATFADIIRLQRQLTELRNRMSQYEGRLLSHTHPP